MKKKIIFKIIIFFFTYFFNSYINIYFLASFDIEFLISLLIFTFFGFNLGHFFRKLKNNQKNFEIHFFHPKLISFYQLNLDISIFFLFHCL